MTVEEKSPVPLRRIVVLAAPLVLFAGLAVVFALQLTSGRDMSELPSALIGKQAPSFDLPPLDGLEENNIPVPGFRSADLNGGATLVNIFASWCAPCRAEHPVLMRLSERAGLSIAGINYKDEPGNALRFLGALGNPYDRVGVDPTGRTAIDWGFYGIPETLLVDRNGIVRHKIVGPITVEKLATLQQALNALD